MFVLQITKIKLFSKIKQIFGKTTSKHGREHLFLMLFFTVMPSLVSLSIGSLNFIYLAELKAITVLEQFLLSIVLATLMGFGFMPSTVLVLVYSTIFKFYGLIPAVIVYAIALLIGYFLNGKLKKQNFDLLSEKWAKAIQNIHQKGFSIVFWCRVSPILPFPAMNYVLKKANLPLSVYFWASILGMLPRMILTFVFCDAIMESIQTGKMTLIDFLLMGFAAVGIVYLGFVGKKIVREVM